MPKFSDRYGYTNPEAAFQRESADLVLRKSLWNVLCTEMWDRYNPYSAVVEVKRTVRSIDNLTKRFWLNYLKEDLDKLPPFKDVKRQETAYDVIKRTFMGSVWFEMYNIIEFFLNDEETIIRDGGIDALNSVLARENAAYRIINKQVVEITDKTEIAAIKEALQVPEEPIRMHLDAALRMLSDKEKPDYRNSIKESISAVEAACRIITGGVATLGQAIKKIPNIHKAQETAFSALYGFTSDSSGIRHSLMDEPTLTYADAKFMLVTCAAFVSYLKASAKP